MKNLKKVLALGLALVMILGMFTIASAAETKKVATELSDWDKVEHKDAVSLMVDLGIIAGKPDGSFDPQGNIDRASWAKMVYFAATGSDDADAYLGTNTGLKDIAGNWAESYICYLAAMKYVSGDNYGNYNPSNNVTVAEANKMMLTVLGWDAEDRGYQNDAAWSGNIMTDAKREGLMEDVDKAQTALVPLTRENAAQIVYNALRTIVVEGEKGRDNGEKFVVKYNRKPYTLGYDVFDLIETTNIVDKLDKDGKAIFATDTNNANGKISATLADVGQRVTVFFQGSRTWDAAGNVTNTTIKNLVSSRVAGANNAPLKVITGGLDWNKSFDKTDDDNYCGYELAGYTDAVLSGGNVTTPGSAASHTATVYVNGEKQTGVYTTNVASGNVVELYDFDVNTDGEVDTIKIYDYSAQKVTGALETRTSSDKLQIRLPGVVNSWTAADKVSGYEGIEKDDVVLSYSNDGNTVIEKAVKVTGKVTKKSQDNKLTVNGTAYAQSGLIASSAAKVGEIDTFKNFDVNGKKDSEFDFYLDKNGDICYGIEITEGTDKTKVAIVLDAWNNFNGNDGSSVARTKLLFTDGTTELVDVAKVGTTKVDSANVSTTVTNLKATAPSAEGASKDTFKFYNYKVNSDGKYELTAMVATDWQAVVDVNTSNANGIEQKAKFDGTNTANSKTMFIVAKGTDEVTYSAYTGFANVPKMRSADLIRGFGIAEKAGEPLKYVFIDTKAFTADGTDGLVYLRDGKFDIDVDGNWTVNVVDAKGEKTTLVVSDEVATSNSGTAGDNLGFTANAADAEAAAASAVIGKFFKVDNTNDDGVITKITLNAYDPASLGDSTYLASIGNDVIKAQDNNISQYDSDTTFVVIDLKVDGEFDSCSSFDPENIEISADNGTADDANVYTSVSFVVTATDGVADFVYVVRVAK